jgi:hypothetical protein
MPSWSWLALLPMTSIDLARAAALLKGLAFIAVILRLIVDGVVERLDLLFGFVVLLL